jgi:hypothetical protein
VKQLFELELAGGPTERHWRKLRPGVEELPWASLDAADYPPELVAMARRSWTEGAFREYCTAAAFARLIEAMLAARAPLDLVGMAGDFVADEMLHAELNARMAMQLGGAAAFMVDFDALVPPIDRSRDARMVAVELGVRVACVGEALSVPLLAGTLRATSHPLTGAVLERIVRDEPAHAEVGWRLLEWADGWLDDEGRAHLGRAAREAIDDAMPAASASRAVDGVTTEGWSVADVNALGWMEAGDYTMLCADVLQRDVIAPLARFGISV